MTITYDVSHGVQWQAGVIERSGLGHHAPHLDRFRSATTIPHSGAAGSNRARNSIIIADPERREYPAPHYVSLRTKWSHARTRYIPARTTAVRN